MVSTQSCSSEACIHPRTSQRTLNQFAKQTTRFGMKFTDSRGRVKKYGLTMMTSVDDQVKAYIKKIMSQLSRWMQKSKISKLVVVITSKETGEHVERWQFDVCESLALANWHTQLGQLENIFTACRSTYSTLLQKPNQPRARTKKTRTQTRCLKRSRRPSRTSNRKFNRCSAKSRPP